MATHLSPRLRQIMSTMGWTGAELAKAAGASKQSVSRWLSDGRIQIDPAFAFRLEDRTGFAARWILLGTGPMDAYTVANEMLTRIESRLRDHRPKN